MTNIFGKVVDGVFALPKWAFNKVAGLADSVATAAFTFSGGAAATQLPAFIASYKNMLQGRLGGMRSQFTALKQSANQLTGGDLEKLVERYARTDKNMAQSAQETIQNYTQIKGTYDHLTAPGIAAGKKPFIFAYENLSAVGKDLIDDRTLNSPAWENLKETWQAYSPNIPLNKEGLYYLAAGAIAGILTYTTFIRPPIRGLWNKTAGLIPFLYVGEKPIYIEKKQTPK